MQKKGEKNDLFPWEKSNLMFFLCVHHSLTEGSRFILSHHNRQDFGFQIQNIHAGKSLVGVHVDEFLYSKVFESKTYE